MAVQRILYAYDTLLVQKSIWHMNQRDGWESVWYSTVSLRGTEIQWPKEVSALTMLSSTQ